MTEKQRRIEIPVNPEVLGELLSKIEYLESKIEYLVEGFTKGFWVGFEGPRRESLKGNHPSARDRPTIVKSKLQKEIDVNRIARPFRVVPLANFVTNPLRLVPKTNEEGDDLPSLHLDDEKSYRLITDLRRGGVNEFIPGDFAKVQYIKFDKVIDLCLEKGVGSFLAKTDIKSAFRNIPVHPEDWHLLGMTFEGEYYFDKCLPFGLSSSCKIFERLSTALESIARGVTKDPGLLHYLDDFLSCERDKVHCDRMLQNLIDICKRVGVPIALEKTVWGCQLLRFLGLDLDMVKQMVVIPGRK